MCITPAEGGVPVWQVYGIRPDSVWQVYGICRDAGGCEPDRRSGLLVTKVCKADGVAVAA